MQRLLLFCERHKITKPEFRSKRVLGVFEHSIWVDNVCIAKITGTYGDLEALSEKALEYLEKLNRRVWVIVDLENIGDKNTLQKLQELHVMTTGVASIRYNNPSAEQYLQDISIINVDQKEAADAYICMIITLAVAKDLDVDKIYILSKDHFMKAIPPVLAQLYKKIPEIYSVTSVDQIGCL